jgi:hypothetical protein
MPTSSSSIHYVRSKFIFIRSPWSVTAASKETGLTNPVFLDKAVTFSNGRRQAYSQSCIWAREAGRAFSLGLILPHVVS